MLALLNSKLDENIIKTLIEKGVIKSTYMSSYEAFIKEELPYFEEHYSEIINKDALKQISKEVEEHLMNTEISFVSETYHSFVEEYLNVLDMEDVAVYNISNTLSIVFKELNDSYFLCVDQLGVVHSGEVLEDIEGNNFVKIEEMEIYLDEIIKI